MMDHPWRLVASDRGGFLVRATSLDQPYSRVLAKPVWDEFGRADQLEVVSDGVAQIASFTVWLTPAAEHDMLASVRCSLEHFLQFGMEWNRDPVRPTRSFAFTRLGAFLLLDLDHAAVRTNIRPLHFDRVTDALPCVEQDREGELQMRWRGFCKFVERPIFPWFVFTAFVHALDCKGWIGSKFELAVFTGKGPQHAQQRHTLISDRGAARLGNFITQYPHICWFQVFHIRPADAPFDFIELVAIAHLRAGLETEKICVHQIFLN